MGITTRQLDPSPTAHPLPPPGDTTQALPPSPSDPVTSASLTLALVAVLARFTESNNIIHQLQPSVDAFCQHLPQTGSRHVELRVEHRPIPSPAGEEAVKRTLRLVVWTLSPAGEPKWAGEIIFRTSDGAGDGRKVVLDREGAVWRYAPGFGGIEEDEEENDEWDDWRAVYPQADGEGSAVNEEVVRIQLYTKRSVLMDPVIDMTLDAVDRCLEGGRISRDELGPYLAGMARRAEVQQRGVEGVVISRLRGQAGDTLGVQVAVCCRGVPGAGDKEQCKPNGNGEGAGEAELVGVISIKPAPAGERCEMTASYANYDEGAVHFFTEKCPPPESANTHRLRAQGGDEQLEAAEVGEESEGSERPDRARLGESWRVGPEGVKCLEELGGGVLGEMGEAESIVVRIL